MGIGAFFAIASSARADAPVVRAEAPCPEVVWSSAALVELLRVELATENVTLAPDDPTAAVAVSATPDVCGDRARGATLVVTRGGNRIERWVDLANVAPNARARALALAAVAVIREMLALPAPSNTITVHVEVVAPPPPPLAPKPLPPAVPSPPPEPVRAFALSLAGEARMFASAGTGLFGARIGTSVPLGPMVLLADAGASFGTTEDALGSVEVTAAGGGLGVALSTGSERFRLLAGPRLELDWIRFAATANAPTTVASRDTSAALLVTLTGVGLVALGHGVWATIGLDAGTTLLGFTAIAGTRPVAGVDGPLLGLRIGASWSSGLP